MTVLPSTGFPATAFPSLPPTDNDKIRQFSVHILPIGRPGEIGFGGRSVINPTSASHM